MKELISFLIGLAIGSGGLIGTCLVGVGISKRRFARRVGVKPSEVASEWTTSDYRT